MSGIHLPDIGKLGIHIATGMKDKKKVAPSNMAENARFRALSTRLDSEKHERSRVLKKEERRMKRKKHKIDQRRQDIQRNKIQDFNTGVDSNYGKGKFPPLISYPKTFDRSKDELSEDKKDVDLNSSSNGSPTSAIFPIQDEFRFFDHQQSRASEKRKFVLPPIETDAVEGRTKHRKPTPFKKRCKKNNMKLKRNNKILERDYEESSELENSKSRHGSLTVAKHLTSVSTEAVFNEAKKETKLEFKFSSPAPTDEKEGTELTLTPANEDESVLQVENGVISGLDETSSASNPFNYLLVEAQRRKVLHQNLEDAFRAIKTCRYIRTSSRAERENHDESMSSN